MNNISPSSIPFELAAHMDEDHFSVTIISFFDSEKGLVGENIEGQSINFIKLGAKSRFDVSALLTLYNWLKRNKIDILHVHHNFTGAIGRIMGKLIGIPVIVDTEHNDHKGFRALGNAINGSTLWLADSVVCNSRNTKNSFFFWEEVLLNKSKKEVIYNGVDIARIQEAKDEKNKTLERFELEENDFLIGNVGMLVKQKNQKRLIKAFSQVTGDIKDAKLVIVGEGKLRNSLTKQAHSLGISDNVIFTGLLDRDEVYQLLHVFDLFAMVSLWEGFCNAVVEAMVARLPVIVSEVEPLPEVVGNAGKYVSPKDPEEIAGAILKMHDNPQGARKLAAEARNRAIEKFSLQRTVSEYQDLYLELVNTNKKH